MFSTVGCFMRLFIILSVVLMFLTCKRTCHRANQWQHVHTSRIRTERKLMNIWFCRHCYCHNTVYGRLCQCTGIKKQKYVTNRCCEERIWFCFLWLSRFCFNDQMVDLLMFKAHWIFPKDVWYLDWKQGFVKTCKLDCSWKKIVCTFTSAHKGTFIAAVY